MKRVVIIGPAHPLRGGLASFDERLAKEFQQLGHQASIYTFSLQYPGFLFPGTTQYSTEPAPSGLHIKVCINSINPINWLHIGNVLRKQKPDVIVVRYWLPFMGPCLGTILRCIKKNRHTRIIAITDNVIPHEKRPGDSLFTKYFLTAVDACITMSEKVMQDLRKYTTKPAMKVVHPLYDNFGERVEKSNARNQLRLPEHEKIILFFGFIRKYKGLDLLIEAMYLLKEKHSKIKLLIAGEYYEDCTKYTELIQQRQLEGCIYNHTQFINDSEVKYYLSAADFVIQPYRQATQSGVTPLAYHFEKPMLVTNVGGLPDLVPNNKSGIVVEPDAKSVAAGIEALYEKGVDYFIPFLQEEKKKYSWSNLVSSIMKLASDKNLNS